MSKPRVAIITRTKDRPLFLKRAINSVASQTFKDYTHVIVNDGGNKAEVEEVIDGVKDLYRARIIVFHRETASGGPDTIFSESIDRVESEYVAIHDDDDTWHEKFLELTISVLDEGSAGVVVRTDKVIEDIRGSEIREIGRSQYLPSLKAISLYRQCAENQLTPISFIYRRSCYEKVGKYDSNLPVVGDWEFGLRFLLNYDVEYLDPGYALSFYHHRKPKLRDNSFSAHSHMYYFNIVANKYLREEMSEGRIGPGYVISSIRYQESFIMNTVRNILPNGISNWLRKRSKN